MSGFSSLESNPVYNSKRKKGSQVRWQSSATEEEGEEEALVTSSSVHTPSGLDSEVETRPNNLKMKKNEVRWKGLLSVRRLGCRNMEARGHTYDMLCMHDAMDYLCSSMYVHVSQLTNHTDKHSTLLCTLGRWANPSISTMLCTLGTSIS
jgi:hypothetical protein